MGAFLENPLLLFVEDAEPILPIFRSAEYNPESRRIVELTDVGCDTETSFPAYFPRGAFDRRRGGAENFGPIRRLAKWRNERLKSFPARTATVQHNFADRNENRMGRKTRRNDRIYDDVYATDLDYDSFAEDLFDDFKFPRNEPTVGYKRDYYTEYRDPRNTIGRCRKEPAVQNARYDYSDDLESRKYNEHAYQRENIYSCWFADNDERNDAHIARDTRSRLSPSNNLGKRTKIRTRTDEDFNHDAEYGKNRGVPKRHEREDVFFNVAADSAALAKSSFWDFISSENESSREEASISKSARVTNRDHLCRMTSKGRGPHNLDSWRKRVDINDTEEASITETREKQKPDSSPAIGSARYQITRTNDSETWRSNSPNANSLRIRSAKMSVDERLSDNIRPARKANTRPRSAVEHRKTSINSSTSTERRKEAANSTSPRIRVDNHRFRDKFGGATVKLLDKPLGQAGRSTKIPRRVVDSRSNERTYAASEENDVNRRTEASSRHIKTDRADRVGLSRSTFEQVTNDEITSALNHALRITHVSPRTETERRQKRKYSRLPVRTWKRVRTRKPAALRLRSDLISEGLNREFREKNIVRETARPGNQPMEAQVDETLRETIVRGSATGDSDNVKRKDHKAGSLGAVKLRLTSANPKDLKGTERNSNATGGTREHRRRKISVSK